MSPAGLNGKHAAYGGAQRDRPLAVDPSTDPQWKLRNPETEVRQAIASGLDGFIISVLNVDAGGDALVYENTNLMMQAAANVDPNFVVMIRPDSASLKNRSAAEIAKRVADLAAYPSAYRVDGKLVVAPLSAEKRSVADWTQFIAIMKSTYGIDVAFMPTFLGSTDQYLRCVRAHKLRILELG